MDSKINNQATLIELLIHHNFKIIKIKSDENRTIIMYDKITNCSIVTTKNYFTIAGDINISYDFKTKELINTIKNLILTRQKEMEELLRIYSLKQHSLDSFVRFLSTI